MGKGLTVVGVLMLTVAGTAPAQAQSTSTGTLIASDQSPFAAFHAELDRTADATLSDAVQRMASAADDHGRNLRQHGARNREHENHDDGESLTHAPPRLPEPVRRPLGVSSERVSPPNSISRWQIPAGKSPAPSGTR